MKDSSFTTLFVVTADQRDSRHHRDAVKPVLEQLGALSPAPWVLPAERTAGDEVQLLVNSPANLVRVLEVLVRDGRWWIGVGLGTVEQPLPESTREARGGAYLAARKAVELAHRSPTGLRLVGDETVSGDAYGEAIRRAEAALWLWQEVLSRRSSEGWQIVDLLEDGLGVGEAARRLGISPSAVSQRHRRAAWEQSVRGRELCADLLLQAQREASEVLHAVEVGSAR